MERREFLRAALFSGALYGSGALPKLGSVAYGAGFPVVDHRVAVKIMLPGGPDLRHLFPPAFDPSPTSFGYRFWQAKASAHNLSDSVSDWQARWENDYSHLTHGATAFGIHGNAGWLKDQWDQGNVAIVNNAFGAATRDHAHCILVMDQGNVDMGPTDPVRSGWGGRLARAAGGNSLALTATPRPFVFGPDPADPSRIDNSNMIPAANTRAMALFRAPPGEPLGFQASVERGLRAYYAAKRDEMSPDAVHQRFTELERIRREFGDAVDERLQSIPVPPAIDALFQVGLASPGFAQQIRNLYDAFAAYDVLQLRTASMDYGGWDSHAGQVNLIEPKLADIFGTGQGLDVLFSELPDDALDNLVIVVAGEFGRQLRANGDNGTDHGVGTSIILVGRGVNGGVYGDMFPEAELERLSDPSPDIAGLTQLDHVFGAVADWVEPGSSASVFRNKATAAAEAGVDFTSLFR